MDGTPHLRSVTDSESTCGTYSAPSGNSVGWVWNAGSSTVSNTDGTITSSVRANTTAGFSIVSYTGNLTSASTVGHGLNAAPKFIILKNRDQAYDWYVFGNAIDSTFDERLTLNSNAASTSSTSAMDATAPTSTVFTVGSNAGSNGSGDDHIAYCWSEVEGYSKFGSYVANLSNYPFVWCGFKPAFIMIKSYTSSNHWAMYDNKRDTHNETMARVTINSTNSEYVNSVVGLDFLSNGFRLQTTDSDTNGSGRSYIFCAFASSPFKYSNAR